MPEAPAAPASLALDAPPAGDAALAGERVSLRTILFPGLYAWATTVALPAWAAPNLAPRIGALGALGLLLAGPWVARTRLALGRVLGVLGFLGLSAGTWGALGPLLALERLDTVRGALGAVAWGFFALGWGSLRRPEHVPERDPRALFGAPLTPKLSLSPRVALGFGAVTAAGVALPLLAWRVRQSDVSLLAHAAALAAAIAVINVGSRLVLSGYDRTSAPARRPQRLFAVLFLLWLTLGVLIWVL